MHLDHFKVVLNTGLFCKFRMTEREKRGGHTRSQRDEIVIPENHDNITGQVSRSTKP